MEDQLPEENLEMMEAVGSIVESVTNEIEGNVLCSSFVNLGAKFVSQVNKTGEKPQYTYDAAQHVKVFNAMIDVFNKAVVGVDPNTVPEEGAIAPEEEAEE